MAAVAGVLAAMGIVGFRGRKRNRSSHLIDVPCCPSRFLRLPNTLLRQAQHARMHHVAILFRIQALVRRRRAHYRPAGVRTVPSLDMYTHLPPRDCADDERLLDLLESLDASCSIATALLATSAVSV
jgi:hypothetical protein